MQRKTKIIVELIVSLIMIYLVIIFTTIISFAPYNMTEIDYSSDFIGPIQIEEDTTTTTTITLTTSESAAGTTSSIITAILASKSQSQTQAATTQEKTTSLKATTTTLKTTKLTTTTTDTTEAIIETDILLVGNARGTYYIPTSRQKGKKLKGGSGRYLIDCSVGDGNIKGSVASAFIYKNYGYNYNNKRTKLYLEIEDYPEMNGYYYLDDCDSGRYNLIDFFYYNGSTCPFCRQGVVKVKCYIVDY